jgi:hypothetical protein
MILRALRLATQAVPFAAILVVLAPYLWPPDRAPGSYFSDIHHQYGPNLMLLARGLARDGELPRWNVQDFAGAPTVGDLQAGVYNPVSWLLLLRPTLHSMGLMIVGYALAGTRGFMLYARELGLSPLAAAAGAVAFTLGGKVMLHLVLPGHSVLAPFFLVPLLLWTMGRVARRPGCRRVAATAAVGALIAVSLHPQVLFYAAWLLLALGLAAVCTAPRPRSALAALAAAAVLGLALAAVHLLPFFELGGEFSRAVPQLYDVARWDAEHPGARARLIDFVLGTSASWEAHYYLGGVTLWLLLVAFLATPRRRAHRRLLWLYGLLAASFLLYGLGPAGGIQPLLAHLPGFTHFRLPARALVVLELPLAVLVALGIDALREAPARRGRIAAVGALLIVAPLLVIANGGARHLALLAAAACGALGGCSGVSGDPEAAPAAPRAISPPSIPSLREALGGLVVLLALALDAASAVAPWVQTVPEKDTALLAPGLALPADAFDIGRIAEVGRDTANPGIPELAKRRYDLETLAGYNSLIPWRFILFATYASGYSPFEHNIGDTVPIRPARRKFFDLLGTTHFLHGPDERGMWRWERAESAVPHAYLVPGPIVVPEGSGAGAVLAEMRALARLEQLDIRERVLLHGPSARVALDSIGITEETPLEPFRPVPLAMRRPNRLALDLDIERAAVLVFNEPYFRGWRAWDGGVELPVLRANVLFRALVLPAGRHAIVLEFSPFSWRAGWWISVAALAVTCGLAAGPSPPHPKARARNQNTPKPQSAADPASMASR